MSMVIHIMFIIGIVLSVLCTARADYIDPHCEGKQVIVELFEWKYSDIADECEKFLGKKGFCGVQVSPVNEYAETKSHSWSERYHPVSYKIASRSGNKSEFKDMIVRCKNVGVRIYVDVVLNHMAEVGTSGKGNAGTTYSTNTNTYPGVPYDSSHFNRQNKCPSPNMNVINYNSKNEVRNCFLNGWSDLDQSQDYVRRKMATFLNHLIDLGVAGFRIAYAKYMWPDDLKAIQKTVKDLPDGGRPHFYNDVFDLNKDAIKSNQYYENGRVTEFRFSKRLALAMGDFNLLNNISVPTEGMTDSDHAFVFVDNHEIQRRESGILTHKTPRNYKMANAFMLAYDYGFPRVMSSYFFDQSNLEKGPPHYTDFMVKNVTSGFDGVCRNGWICEHRWNPIGNMVAFRNAVVNTTIILWRNKNQQVSFARGSKGFFAMTRNGFMNETLYTGMNPGTYCDIISDCKRQITVDAKKYAYISIKSHKEPMVAFLADGSSPNIWNLPYIYVGKSVGLENGNETNRGNGTGNTGGDSTTGIPTTNPTTTIPTTNPTTTIPTTKTTTTVTTTPTTTVTTTIPTTTTTTAVPTTRKPNFQRTVILIQETTVTGQDLFIQGGIDKRRRKGCTLPVASIDPCAIPIRSHDLGNSQHFSPYNEWRKGDNFLDWHGREPHQGYFHGKVAYGTPAVWTTNNRGDGRYNDQNKYGEHYWLVDIEVDCDKTMNGWFEVGAMINDQHELRIPASLYVCGNWKVPYESTHHWAKCGMKNVFHYNQDTCSIVPIS